MSQKKKLAVGFFWCREFSSWSFSEAFVRSQVVVQKMM